MANKKNNKNFSRKGTTPQTVDVSASSWPVPMDVVDADEDWGPVQTATISDYNQYTHAGGDLSIEEVDPKASFASGTPTSFRVVPN